MLQPMESPYLSPYLLKGLTRPPDEQHFKLRKKFTRLTPQTTTTAPERTAHRYSSIRRNTITADRSSGSSNCMYWIEETGVYALLWMKLTFPLRFRPEARGASLYHRPAPNYQHLGLADGLFSQDPLSLSCSVSYPFCSSPDQHSKGHEPSRVSQPQDPPASACADSQECGHYGGESF